MDIQPVAQEEPNAFDERVIREEGRPLHSVGIDTIQVNVGLTCNLQCAHCHVAAGPRRTEQMSWETMEQILAAARRAGCRMIDITGGAPEMNPHFRPFVEALRQAGLVVQVRTNLAVLTVAGYEEMAPFMAQQGVWLVGSLPCYLEENVDAQRGHGTYAADVRALRMLNGLGYGIRPELPLDLIYNPLGPALPPNQEKLEEDYRRELDRRFGIRFTHLHIITNMPIGRFWADLRHQKKDESYEALLQERFNPRTLAGLMCRHQISVDWDGQIHDCDFNLALRLTVDHGAPRTIGEFDPEALATRQIVTGRHCFGCTAGCGSSCGGAIAGQ
jgi:radical SAM/Cys-rich protein